MYMRYHQIYMREFKFTLICNQVKGIIDAKLNGLRPRMFVGPDFFLSVVYLTTLSKAQSI